MQTTAFRLSLAYAALFAIAAALAIGYIYWQTHVIFARQTAATIAAELTGLEEQYRDGGMPALINAIERRALKTGDGLYLLTDEKGQFLAGNLRSVTTQLWNVRGLAEFPYQRPNASGAHETGLAIASVSSLPGGFHLIVGRDLSDQRVFERVTRSAFFWGLGVVVLVGLSGGIVLSRRLLRRIDAMTSASQAIMAGALSQRIPLAGSGDELDRLGASLNAMLDRIERLMTGLREVSDNIAHDLKTPLTRLRGRAEAALHDKRGEVAYREALEQTIEEADELIRIFNALLSIARLEAGAERERFERLDLGAVVCEVAELYEPLAEAQGAALLVDAAQGLKVRGDRQLLAQAIANLLDNAMKYGARQSGAVTLDARRRDAMIEIAVGDHGPGIPASERARVLERFVRLETSRSQPGSGLGLSLVAAVARLHGGTVRLEDNAPGLRVLISVPQDA